MKFTRLTVIGEAPLRNHLSHWRCLCDCGKEVVVSGHSLARGNTKSCGCMRGDSHGYSKTKLHTVWRNIKARCSNPKHPAYARYGGRGIKLCDEWLVFSRFKDWALAHGYDESLTLDRVDNDADYAPDNCRWVDMKAQARNRSNNVRYRGKTVGEWSELCGIKASTLYNRICKGWSLERAISEPVHRCGRRVVPRRLRDACPSGVREKPRKS